MADETPVKPMVDWNQLGKYSTGGVIYASLFYLTYIGKIPAETFVGLASAGLAALGYNVASK